MGQLSRVKRLLGLEKWPPTPILGRLSLKGSIKPREREKRGRSLTSNMQGVLSYPGLLNPELGFEFCFPLPLVAFFLHSIG